MRRFNYDDNEEYREDVDNFFDGDQGQGMSPEEYKALMEEELKLQQWQISLVYRDLNSRVLRTAIKMCERSFWWRFYSHDTRLRMIDKAYKKLKNLEEQ